MVKFYSVTPWKCSICSRVNAIELDKNQYMGIRDLFLQAVFFSYLFMEYDIYQP